MWSPAAVRRLVALVAGIAFFGLGIFMLLKGIAATGAVDIQSAVISGKIQTGSAGLLISFLATIIIIFASAAGDGPHILANRDSRATSDSDRPGGLLFASVTTLRLFFAILLLSGVIAFLQWVAAKNDANNAIAGIVNLASVGLGFVIAFLFACLIWSFFVDTERADPVTSEIMNRPTPPTTGPQQ